MRLSKCVYQAPTPLEPCLMLERAPSALCVGQCSQPSPVHLDTKNTLYAGEKPMPKLVTAESCVGEGNS